MYHIPNDKRAKRSAELLSQALLVCLESKEFHNISISDLNKVSYVSRSTFYRLFDNTVDILLYMSDRMFEETIAQINAGLYADSRELMIAFNRSIMSRGSVLNAIAKSHRVDILYNTQLKYADTFLPYFTAYKDGLSEKEKRCIIAILTSALCSYISLWSVSEKQESPEELTDLVMKSFRVIAETSVTR